MLSIINICISNEILYSWHGIALSLQVSLFDFFLDSLFDFLKLLFSSKIVFKDQGSDLLNAVSLLSDFLDFLSGSVGVTWVRHRVSVVSVGITFDHERSIFYGVLFGPFECFSNSEEIISVNSESWNLVSSGVEVGIHG